MLGHRGGEGAAGLAAVALTALLLAGPGVTSAASAAGAKPFGIASFTMRTTRTVEVPRGPGMAGYGFLEEPYPFSQAGGRPQAVTSTVEFEEAGGQSQPAAPAGDPRNLEIELPPGLLANPLAVPRCPFAQAAEISGSRCPAGTQVGEASLRRTDTVEVGPVVDLTPEPGQPAELGLETSIGKVTLPLPARLVRTAQGYRLAIVAGGLPALGILGVRITLWGVPGAPLHDPERGLFCHTAGTTNEAWSCEGGGESSGAGESPFLTMPSDCAGGPLTATMFSDSWEEPGRYVRAQAMLPATTGCDLLPFAPSLEVDPETQLADEPLGLSLNVKSAQGEGSPPPPLRDLSLTLPQGVSIDPSAADGLTACRASGPEGVGMPSGVDAAGTPLTPEELGEGEQLGPDGLKRLAPGHCPQTSVIGSAEARTPLLEHALHGRVYLGGPLCGGAGEAACTGADAAGGGLSRLYLELGGVAEAGAPSSTSPGSGVVIKLEANLRVDPGNGQLTVEIADAPQLPITDLSLSLTGGPQALLASPPGCGRAATTSDLMPWSAPGLTPQGLLVAGALDASPSSFYEVNGCSPATRFSPGFSAGTVNPLAGAPSPLVVNLTRADREPYLRQFQVDTPPGLSAALAGVTPCGEVEASTGSCPPSSRIGSSLIAAGAGPYPFQLPGTVYLTGPYEGAPFGVAIVTEAVVGPLALGRIVARARVDVDPMTAALTITSDPLPQMLLGVPLRLRRMSLDIDRPGFILNPTDCSALAVRATVASTLGATVSVSSPFAAARCYALPFHPALRAGTQANGQFEGHGASLHVVLTTAPAVGAANLRSMHLALPQRLPARLGTVQRACTETVFDRDPAACPRASLIGYAQARTPMLSAGMAGPVFLVAKDRPHSARSGAFPDMVVVLQAQGVRIDLRASLYVSERNVTSATFASLPDVPIRRLDLVLPQGPHSMLAAGGRLCGRPLRISSALTAQNGARLRRSVRVSVSGCRRYRRPDGRRRG